MNDPDRIRQMDLSERELAQIAIALALYGAVLAAPKKALVMVQALGDSWREVGHAGAEILDVSDLIHRIERVASAPLPPPGRG